MKSLGVSTISQSDYLASRFEGSKVLSEIEAKAKQDRIRIVREQEKEASK